MGPGAHALLRGLIVLGGPGQGSVPHQRAHQWRCLPMGRTRTAPRAGFNGNCGLLMKGKACRSQVVRTGIFAPGRCQWRAKWTSTRDALRTALGARGNSGRAWIYANAPGAPAWPELTSPSGNMAYNNTYLHWARAPAC